MATDITAAIIKEGGIETNLRYRTLDEAIAEFHLAKAGLTTGSVSQYKQWLNIFRATASGVWPVPAREIAAFIDGMRSRPITYANRARIGFSPSTIRTCVTILRVFFK